MGEKIKKRNRGTKYTWFSFLGFLITTIYILLVELVLLTPENRNLFAEKWINILMYPFIGTGLFCVLFLVIRLLTCFIRKEAKVYRVNVILMVLSFTISFTCTLFAAIYIKNTLLLDGCYGGSHCSGDVCECNDTMGHGFLDLFTGYKDYLVWISLILPILAIINYFVMFILMIVKTKPIRITIKENKQKRKEEKERSKQEKEEQRRIELENKQKEKEEQKRLEEEKARLEEERLAKEEEAKRLEEERLAKEKEAKRLEEEKKEQERLEEEKQASLNKKNESIRLDDTDSSSDNDINDILDASSENMEDKLIEYSQKVLLVIAEKGKEYRVNFIPKEYRKLLLECIFYDLFAKENDLLYGWGKEDINWMYNQLSNWFNNLSVLEALRNLIEYLNNWYSNYENNIRNANMSYETKQSYINEKASAISAYIENTIMNQYFKIVEKENNDDSLEVLKSMANVLTTGKTFYNAKRICDDTLMGKLALLSTAAMSIESLNTFLTYKDSQKQIMQQILHIHNGFKNIYLEKNVKIDEKLVQTTFEDFTKYYLRIRDLTKNYLRIRDYKIYFLNLVYMSYNQIKNNYFSIIAQDAMNTLNNQDIVPEKLLNSKALLTLTNYFNDKRVDTMKEAINLYFQEEKENEQYNKVMNEMNAKVASLTYELNQTKTKFNQKTREMEDAYEQLREKNNSLVDAYQDLAEKHNSLVDEHNSLVDKHNETIEVAREIRDELNRY